jgi:site-specific DNA-methyltransferase (adenine-specific)
MGLKMEFHEFASVFPLLEGDELEELALDIRKVKKCHEPVTLFEGKVLDGRNRVTACALAGVKPTFREFSGTREEALDFVWSENEPRRHLTGSQRAACAHAWEVMRGDIVKAIQNDASAREKSGKGADGSGGRGKKKTLVNDLTRVSGQDNSQRTDAKIAKRTKSNRQYVTDMRKIAANRPELVEAVKKGDKTVPQARREVERETKRQDLEAKAAAVQFSAEQPPWTLIQADVLDGLQSVLDHHAPARLIFTDPPYNIGIDYGDGASADRLPDAKYMLWVAEWIDLCREVLSPDGSLWVMIGDEYAAEYGVALKAAGFTIRNWIKWYETFGVNCSNQFNRTSRHIFYCVRDAKRFVFNQVAEITRPSDRQTEYNDKRANPGGKLWDDVWEIPRLAGTSKERIPDFPTQLPLALLRPIIACTSEPGDLVVDPFSGSATTGVAAVQDKRKYVGIEKSRKYIDLSDKRLKVAL